MAGYHEADIERGEYGELSKIQEELDEAIDAQNQGIELMVLVELSDIIGAIDGYLNKHYKGAFMIEDLYTMAMATKKAFVSGYRK